MRNTNRQQLAKYHEKYLTSVDRRLHLQQCARELNIEQVDLGVALHFRVQVELAFFFFFFVGGFAWATITEPRQTIRPLQIFCSIWEPTLGEMQFGLNMRSFHKQPQTHSIPQIGTKIFPIQRRHVLVAFIGFLHMIPGELRLCASCERASIHHARAVCTFSF